MTQISDHKQKAIPSGWQKHLNGEIINYLDNKALSSTINSPEILQLHENLAYITGYSHTGHSSRSPGHPRPQISSASSDFCSHPLGAFHRAFCAVKLRHASKGSFLFQSPMLWTSSTSFVFITCHCLAYCTYLFHLLASHLFYISFCSQYLCVLLWNLWQVLSELN